MIKSHMRVPVADLPEFQQIVGKHGCWFTNRPVAFSNGVAHVSVAGKGEAMICLEADWRLIRERAERSKAVAEAHAERLRRRALPLWHPMHWVPVRARDATQPTGHKGDE